MCAGPDADRGKILAVPDERLVIHIWDTAAGKERCALQAQGDHFLSQAQGDCFLGSLALSVDRRWLASLTQDAVGTYYVQLWDLATGKAAHRVAVDQKYIAAVAFSPNGKMLATVGWYEVRLWDVATGQERSRAQGVQSFAPSVAFSPDGKTLATAETYSVAIHLWDVASGALKPQPSGHTNAPYQLGFSADGRAVASGGGMDGTIFVWDPATGASLAQIRRSGGLRGLTFSVDGRSLYSCWTSDKLEFFDAVSGRELDTIKLEDPDRPDTQQHGSHMRLSDDGKTLIAISSYSPKKGGAYIPEFLVTGWDTATRKQLFRRRRGRVDFGLAISPDGKVLAVSQGGFREKGPKVPAGQGPIRLEDLATGEELVSVRWNLHNCLSSKG
jgi:WD40 repeat protein